MGEIDETIKEVLEEKHGGESPLNSRVALLVALTATLMAIGHIKNEGIVLAMEVAQSKSVGAWNYYQAKSTKQIIAENMADQLKAQLAITPNLSAGGKQYIEKRVEHFESEGKRYEKEKEEIRKQAEGYEESHDALHLRDDQLKIAEACFTVAIALAGITALTRKRWMFVFALVMSCMGFVLEAAAAFAGVVIRSEGLAKLLGA